VRILDRLSKAEPAALELRLPALLPIVFEW